jgi:hypothetical protein
MYHNIGSTHTYVSFFNSLFLQSLRVGLTFCIGTKYMCLSALVMIVRFSGNLWERLPIPGARRPYPQNLQETFLPFSGHSSWTNLASGELSKSQSESGVFKSHCTSGMVAAPLCTFLISIRPPLRWVRRGAPWHPKIPYFSDHLRHRSHR